MIGSLSDITAAIKAIQAIRQAYEQAECNKAECESLYTRISRISDTVRSLMPLVRDSDTFLTGAIESLKTATSMCQKFMESSGKSTNVFKRMWNAAAVKEQTGLCNAALSQCQIDLGTCLSTALMMRQQQEETEEQSKAGGSVALDEIRESVEQSS